MSVQPCFGKIFEIIFLKRFLAFIESNNILKRTNLYPWRGCRPMTLSSLYFRILPPGLIGRTSSASFMMYQGLWLYLLKKLLALGVDGIPLKWIISYLRDGKLVVTLKHLRLAECTPDGKITVSSPINVGMP